MNEKQHDSFCETIMKDIECEEKWMHIPAILFWSSRLRECGGPMILLAYHKVLLLVLTTDKWKDQTNQKTSPLV